jgi:hypothetical protein
VPLQEAMLYQLGWTTLPGLRGLSVSDFRAEPAENPNTEREVVAEFADEAACEGFLKAVGAEFSARRFSNAADAFDTVKTYVLEHASKEI